MAKGNGGTRATNSNTAHRAGGNFINSSSPTEKQVKEFNSIVKEAGIPSNAVRTDGIRYVNVGEPQKLVDGMTYQRQEMRRDRPEIRLSTDDTPFSGNLTIYLKKNGEYLINEAGSRPDKALVWKGYTKKETISILKEWKNYYKNYKIK